MNSIARRMQPDFHHGLLTLGVPSPPAWRSARLAMMSRWTRRPTRSPDGLS